MKNNQSNLTLNKESFFRSKLFCYLAPFTVLAAYLIYIIAADKVELSRGYYELQYLFTYDHGFNSKGFIGEVISWFVPTLTPDIIMLVTNIGSVLLLIAATLCFGSALDKTRDDRDAFQLAAIFVAILCIAPFTFRSFFTEMRVDKFFWAFALFAVYFSQFKVGIWLAPVFCFIATLVNPVFLLGAMFLISIILLQKCVESGASKKNVIICAIAYVGMIALGLYSVSSSSRLGFADEYELLDFYFRRYSEPLMPSKIETLVNVQLVEYFEKKDFALVKAMFEDLVINGNHGAILLSNGITFSVPLLALLTAFWVKVIKVESNVFEKFVFFLCPATMVTLICPIFLGWGSRFFFYSYVVQACLILYFVATKNESVMTVIGRVRDYCKSHTVVAACIVIYFAIFMNGMFI
ncbi:MAG: hypothetical protein IKB88_10825 [Clostridia bacterium]|nr:hypothetical protein [Clostridia bacterium]